MLRRILIISIFTGFGQLYSIFVIKLLTNISSGEPSVAIAQLDSLFMFILNAIAFGLQSAAIRDLALSEDWKKQYAHIQSARISFSLLMIIAIIGLVFNQYYFIFLLAPVVACSGEYALYARGFPVFGSIISCLRLTIPFTCVLISAYIEPSYAGIVYVVSIFATYLLTNFLISRYLRVGYFFKPAFSSLKLYLQSFPLGMATISLYMIGLGLVLFAPYFYQSETVTIAFAGLKFYVLYKGVLRIIHQAFVKDMLSESVCFKVDQLSILLSLLFLSSVIFFPHAFIQLFFGAAALPHQDYFLMLGIGAVIYSFFLSMSTSALLQKKDIPYSIVSVIAAGAMIVSAIVFSYFKTSPIPLGVAICIGEFIWVCGLVWIATERERVVKRILFLAECSLFLAVPLVIRFYFEDTGTYYVLSMVLLGLILLLLHFRKFRI